MAKGKVQHWKHGWIPIDPLAEAVVAKKAAPNVSTYKPPTEAERKAIVAKELAKTPEQIRTEERKAAKAQPTMVGSFDAQAEYAAARARREQYRDVTTVDGVDFIHYKESRMDPMGTEHGEPYQLTRDQMQPLADAYNEVKAEFPGLKPVQIVGVDGSKGAFGITSWDGRRISISSDLFNPKQIQHAQDTWIGLDGKSHGAVAGQFLDDPEGFARAVMTHELGHALQMQNDTARRKGKDLAMERVTAAEVGLEPDPGSLLAVDPSVTAPRWSVDTLDGKSVYATGNEYEWFAEAFADGFFDGKKALPQSQKVLAMLHDVYGGVTT